MPVKVSEEDRRLIDDAIAAGKVQHIPSGIYGIDPVNGNHGWREKITRESQNHTKMRAAREAKAAKAAEAAEQPAADPLKPIDHKIHELRTNGMTVPQIAGLIGVNHATVKGRLYRMKKNHGLETHRPKKSRMGCGQVDTAHTQARPQ